MTEDESGWRSSYFLNVDACDGYLFMETASVSVIHKTTISNRRLDTVPLGWKVF